MINLLIFDQILDHRGKWDKSRGKPGKHKEEVRVCVLVNENDDFK